MCTNQKYCRYCLDEDGNDVELMLEGAEDTADTATESEDSESESAGENCHFHAGVE
jgi:hypothetical protein